MHMVSGKVETPLIDQTLEHATHGLEPYFLAHLKTRISLENGLVIARYIQSMRIETNLSDNHRRGVITSLKIFINYISFLLVSTQYLGYHIQVYLVTLPELALILFKLLKYKI